MNNIQKALVENKPKEKGGAISEERLGYQKDWAICKLLELHKKEVDYLMVFEYHDDVLILDNSIDPSLISFYQVKTKNKGTWSVNDLANKKSEVNSYLGKLWLHKIDFPNVNSTLNFVSNARYSIKLNNANHKSTDLSNICFCDILNSEQEYINNNLTKELDASDNIEVKDVFFHVSSIPIQNSEMASIAALVDYFEELDNQRQIPKLKPLYTTLINEIRRKSKYTFEVTSFEELIQCRSFSRQEFQNMLTHALRRSSFDLKEIQNQIFLRLNSENANIRIIQQFANNSKVYILNKLDITNEVVRKTDAIIQEIIRSLDENDFNQQLLPCVEIIFQKYLSIEANNYLSDKSYIQAVILFQIYGNYEL